MFTFVAIAHGGPAGPAVPDAGGLGGAGGDLPAAGRRLSRSELHGLLLVVLVVAAIGCYACTLAPMTWVVLSEIFPNRIRGAAMSMAVFALWTGCFTLTYSFPLLNRALARRARSGFTPPSAWSGSCSSRGQLPETKGKTLGANRTRTGGLNPARMMIHPVRRCHQARLRPLPGTHRGVVPPGRHRPAAHPLLQAQRPVRRGRTAGPHALGVARSNAGSTRITSSTASSNPSPARVFHAETFPVFFPNLGPSVYSAFYAGRLEFAEVTSWYEPVLADLDDLSRAPARSVPERLFQASSKS